MKKLPIRITTPIFLRSEWLYSTVPLQLIPNSFLAAARSTDSVFSVKRPVLINSACELVVLKSNYIASFLSLQ